MINSVWRKDQQKEQESFKKIMENQIKKENVTKTIVKVIKKSENLVRDAVEKKKSVIVFGLGDDNIPVRQEREVREKRWLRRC